MQLSRLHLLKEVKCLVFVLLDHSQIQEVDLNSLKINDDVN